MGGFHIPMVGIILGELPIGRDRCNYRREVVCGFENIVCLQIEYSDTILGIFAGPGNGLYTNSISGKGKVDY